MDYRDVANVMKWHDYKTFTDSLQPADKPPNLWSYSSKSTILYSSVRYTAGDYLIFGSETAGLPDDIFQSVQPANRLHIPMQHGSRSLNLSNAVAIASYEAWRQIGYN